MKFHYLAILFLLSLLNYESVHAQYSFDYIHWSGQPWHVDIVKSFNQGSDMPEARFKHTLNGQSHYERFMDYKSDAGENWRAYIKYRVVGNNVEFYFTHCKGGGGKCHDDVIINLLAYGSANKQVRLQPCSLTDFKMNTEYIKGDDRGIPKPPAGHGSSSGGTTGGSGGTVDNPFRYIANDIQTHDRNRSIICKDHFYINTNERRSIRLVVQYQGSLFDSDCSKNENGVRTKTLRPGEKLLFFSNIGGNPNIISATFTQ